MSNTLILTVLTVIGVGSHRSAVGVGIGRVQWQEVRIRTANGIGGRRQIFINIEAVVGLIVGKRITQRVVVIITIMLIIWIIHNLKQMIGGAQVGLANDTLASGKVKCVLRGVQ